MAKVSQTTPVKDMVINQGEDYRFQLKLYTGTSESKAPINITGYTFTCKVRKEAEDDDAIITAECTVQDSVNGLVEVHFKADDTDDASVDGTYYGELGKFTYDVFMKDTSGNESRVLCGYCYISPSVSNR